MYNLFMILSHVAILNTDICKKYSITIAGRKNIATVENQTIISDGFIWEKRAIENWKMWEDMANKKTKSTLLILW